MSRNNGLHALCNLGPKWRLSCDRLQWILEQREGSKWRARYFISRKRDTLERILREEMVYPLTPEAEAFIGGLPETFSAFRKSKLEEFMAA